MNGHASAVLLARLAVSAAAYEVIRVHRLAPARTKPYAVQVLVDRP